MTILFATYSHGTAVGTLPKLRGIASPSVLGNTALGRLPRLRGYASPAITASGQLPRLRSVATSLSGQIAIGRLPKLKGYASSTGVMEPAIAFGYGALPRLRGIAHGFSTVHVNAAGTLPRLRSVASPLAGPMAIGRLPQLRGIAMAAGLPQNYATLYLSPGYMATISTATMPTIILTSSLLARDTLSASFVLALLDLFTASDTYATTVESLQQLLDVVNLVDVAQFIYDAALVDSFIASGLVQSTAQITLLLSDVCYTTDVPTSTSQILEILQDAMYVSVVLDTGDAVYNAWVMTPQTKAMRRYTNFQFNSFAMLNGEVLAASPTGIYRFGGTTDAGTPIAASIKSGLLNFNTQNLKRIERAYLGYTSSGTLCLKMCAINALGAKTEYIYKMVPRSSDAPHEGRVQVGRGVRSLYWSFELCNDATGSDFELHDISVLPLVLDRRIS